LYEEIEEDVKIEEVLTEESRSLVVVDVEDSLSNVFAQLQRQSTVVAVVRDATTQKWIGFIDVVDILTTLLSATSATPPIASSRPNGAAASDWTNGATPAVDEDEDLLRVTCTSGDAANRSKRNPFLKVKSSDSLLLAIKSFVQNDAHYLPVFNEESKLLAVIEGWTVLAYIHENLPAPARNRNVMAFGNFEPLATIKASTPTIDAFHILVEKNLSAAAVVDDNEGLLLDNLSALDSRSLSFHDSTWAVLSAPLIEFLRESVENVGSIVDTPSRRKLLDTYMRSNCVCSEPNARWTDLAAAIVEDEVHRVYIAEKGNRPAGYVDINLMLGALLQ